MIYLIYLAAGNSTRFGEKNKLLHMINNKSIFTYGLDTLCKIKNVYEDEIQIVVVTKYEEIRDYAKYKALTTVFEAKMPPEVSYTIKKGVLAAENLDPNDYLMFVVADQPLLSFETIEEFVKLSKNKIVTARTCYEDKIGNPVMFSAKLKHELLQLDGDTGGRILLKKYPPIMVSAKSSFELFDVDDEESLNIITDLSHCL